MESTPTDLPLPVPPVPASHDPTTAVLPGRQATPPVDSGSATVVRPSARVVVPDLDEATVRRPSARVEKTVVLPGRKASSGPSHDALPQVPDLPVTDAVQPPMPRRVGPYSVLESLGQGGMGRVLLAEDSAGIKVALKILSPRATEVDARRFEREARLLASVDHPNVVGLLGHGVDPETKEPYLALELVSGRDLDSALLSRPDASMAVEEVSFIIERVAQALTAVHALGIVHRDVKPSNVLITPEGEVKLTDFGIALPGDTQEGRLTGADEILGSVHYLAPEVIASDKLGPAADLYSLGALGYRLLTAEPLFAGRDVHEVLTAHVRERPPGVRTRRPDAPPVLASIIDRLLSKDPAERPTASDVARRLSGVRPHTTLIARLWTAEEAASRSRTISDRLRADQSVKLNQYRIERELGRGGMGVVYLAWHLGLKKPVALKTLLAGSLATDEERRRFLKEAEAAASLVHPNIVRVLDAGQVEGTYFLAMEQVEGKSLTEHMLRATDADRERLLRVFVGVCDGLSHAHQNGVIHRDVKPDNVLVDEAGVPRILDFGMAKRRGSDTASLTADGDILGTIRYMSPEQAAGRVSEVDERSDIWSLGAILYELVAGTTPYVGTAQDVLVKLHLEEPPPPRARRPDVPWELEAIILKAIDRDRRERYPSVQALKEDVERYLGNRPITARRASAGYRTRKWMTRNRRRLLAGLGLGLASLALVVGPWAYSDRRRERERHAEVARATLDGLRRLQGDPVGAAAAFDRARGQLEPGEQVSLALEARPLVPEEGGARATSVDAARLARWAGLAEARRVAEVARATIGHGRTALREGRLEAAAESVTKAGLLAPDDAEVVELRRQTWRRCGGAARASLDLALDLPVARFAERGRLLDQAREALDLVARLAGPDELAPVRARVDDERALMERDRALFQLAEEAARRRAELMRGIDVRAPTRPRVADGEDAARLVVTVRGPVGTPRVGCRVAFEAEGGGRLLEPEVTTNAKGEAWGHLVSTIAGVTTVTVTVALGEDEVRLGEPLRIHFRPGPPDARTSLVAAVPDRALADGAAVVTLTVTVRDRHGNPVPDARVEVAADGRGNQLAPPPQATSQEGVATASLASTVAEVKSITVLATAGETRVTLEAGPAVRFLAGAPGLDACAVSASPAAGVTADAAQVATITVCVRDAHGNPVPGQTVKLEATGAGNALVQPLAPTGEDGLATGGLLSSVAEVKTVTVILDPGSHQVALPRAANVEFVPGPLDAGASGVQVQPGADGTAAVLVTARDALGNPIPGLRVELEAPGATLTVPTAVTDAQGEVRGAVAWNEAGTLPPVTATIYTRDGPQRLGPR